MLATASKRPPGPDPTWAVEMKWDGMQAISQISGTGARFWSRNGHEVTLSFPELAEAFPGIVGLVLDGEIVAPDPATGVPSFGRLQHRLGTRPSTALRAAVPVRYFVFDVLENAAESVMDLPYLERRERLDELHLDGGPIRVPPTWIGEDPERMHRNARSRRAATGVASGRRGAGAPLSRRSFGCGFVRVAVFHRPDGYLAPHVFVSVPRVPADVQVCIRCSVEHHPGAGIAHGVR